ncbi:MAG: D-Ala-D-Ala carboxypeptidase family metallohydrolase [Cyanophyceae cyanobacterium]
MSTASGTINLENFFHYYDRRNPQHLLAIQRLSEQMSAALQMDSSDWVKIYRTPLQAPAAEEGKSIAATESVRQPYSGVIDWDDPNSYVSEYFTVKEVTQGDRRRIPQTDDIKQNIVTLAKYMDEVRKLWGSAIGVTSWYRPPRINAMVGGVRNSQHISGRAVDVYPLNGKSAEFEQWLDQVAWKNRALGYGVASGRGFTHLDLRPKRIRWHY